MIDIYLYYFYHKTEKMTQLGAEKVIKTGKKYKIGIFEKKHKKMLDFIKIR